MPAVHGVNVVASSVFRPNDWLDGESRIADLAFGHERAHRH